MKAELLKCYPTITEEDLALVFPNKEEMSIMKIETHGGEVVSTHVVGKKPLVFHIRDKIYPTVYLLWALPGKLLPYFTTWMELLPKFQNGAEGCIRIYGGEYEHSSIICGNSIEEGKNRPTTGSSF